MDHTPTHIQPTKSGNFNLRLHEWCIFYARTRERQSNNEKECMETPYFLLRHTPIQEKLQWFIHFLHDSLFLDTQLFHKEGKRELVVSLQYVSPIKRKTSCHFVNVRLVTLPCPYILTYCHITILVRTTT